METKKFESKLGDKKIIIEQGLVPQADAALKITYGETVVLVTAVMDNNVREGADFLPLSVEYREKYYAAGRIKGSRFIKREGRPSDEATLTGRVIDRIIRPRFNQKLRNEIQVVATVLSFDGINDPDVPAVIGASLALSTSRIPWNGPMAAVRIAKDFQGNFLINPAYEQKEASTLDIILASDGELVNMIELGSPGAEHKEIMEAIHIGRQVIQDNIKFQKDIIEKLKTKKTEVDIFKLEDTITKKAHEYLDKELSSVLIDHQDKIRFKEDLNKVHEGYFDIFSHALEKTNEPFRLKDALEIFFEDKVDYLVHENILNKGKRPDNRKMDEVRKLDCQVGLLPRPHGSGLFARGLTHVLSVVTLAGPGEEQLLDEMEKTGNKRFMHHYNFPPYSVGETGYFRGPGRREIGHGALAEKALSPMIPDSEKFPYTIRIVSEVLSSNGSSSMASVCGSTLALLDAGVPIKNLVSGIAMGLVSNEKKYKILTDIQGPEDHYGDMDLKVAGTEQKVTAMQMDVKIEGVTEEILEKALEQAQKARKEILVAMKRIISEPRKNLSPYAPIIESLIVKKDQIGGIIGGGGKTINGIIEKTNTLIDIKDDGHVYISGEKKEDVQRALRIINDLVKEFKAEEIVTGEVSRILDFGAFVKLTENHEGLIHISKLAPQHVNKVTDIVKEGDKVKVKVINIDDLGRINLKLLENHIQPIKQEKTSRQNDKNHFARKSYYYKDKSKKKF
jgi:polyribonucleotide nucleotidyltransferase